MPLSCALKDKTRVIKQPRQKYICVLKDSERKTVLILHDGHRLMGRNFVLSRTPLSATHYSSIPGNRNWQIETADWNLDVRLDI